MSEKTVIDIENQQDIQKREQQKFRQKELIKLVMRQTDYTEETVKQKLIEWNNNYIKVIKEYINPNFDKKSEKIYKSTNQGVMTEIRGFMDKINRDYYRKKELTEKYNMFMAQQKAQKKNQKINDPSNN